MRVVEWVVTISAIVFMLELLFPRVIIDLFSFSLEKAIYQPWRWITNVFLHASFLHLFFNSVVILSIGSFVEDEIGSKNMLILFFSSVIIANLSFGILNPKMSGIGASGFAFAISGIATILNPNLPVIVWGFPTTMGVAGWFFFFMELSLAILFPGSEIAHIAHVGGFIVGLIFGYYLRRKKFGREYIVEIEYYW